MARLGAFLVVALAVTATWSDGGGPRPASAEAPASVAFVGDSIGRDAQPEITARVTPTNPIAYFHAIGAGYTDYHLPLLLPIVQDPDGPDIVVAELGTGDAFWSSTVQQFETSMRRFLRQVTPHVDCVLWLDQKPGGNRAYPMINDRAEAFNEVVHRVANADPKATYVHYAEWTRLADAPSPYFLGDYLHLTPAGEDGLALLVSSAVRGCDPDLTSGPFWDVQDDFWAADAIAWAAGEGIVTGYDNGSYRAVVGQFRPTVTRGQAAQMVWRLRGTPPVGGGHGWSDVPRWLAPALRWGRFRSVFDGYPNGTFRPDEEVTRGRLLSWLWKAAGQPTGYLGDHPWPDAPQSLRLALKWAAAEGIVTDIGDFRANGTVDRATIAVWLQATDAFLALPPPPAPPTTAPPPSSVPATAPATAAPTTVPPTTVSPTTVVP